MNQITVECKHVSKTFGEGEGVVHALHDITLTIRENETILLMGPSGSGKTTLLSIIGGILDQDAGDCIILGANLKNLSDAQKTVFRGRNIGFMFQIFNLVPTLNCIENVSIPLLLNGIKEHEAQQKASQLLSHMGLDRQQTHSPNDLSGGEQQRVAIARACIHKPKIILCDEPTSFLDLQMGKKIMQMLKDIQKETSCSLVVVTHDPRILEFADRILEIEDGRINEKPPQPSGPRG